MAVKVGELYEELVVRDKTGPTLAQAERSLGNTNQAVGALKNALMGLGIAAGVRAVWQGLERVGAQAESIKNLAQTTQLSTTRLQELKYIAETSGLSFETISSGVAMVQAKLMGMDDGTGNASEALQRLGISVRDANGNLQGMDTLFPQIIAKLQSVTNETERNMLAAQVFGRGWKELAPILGMSTAEFERARQRAHELGVVMSSDALDSAAQFDDMMDDLKQSMQGLGLQAGQALIPVLRDQLFPVIQSDVIPAVRKLLELVADGIRWFGGLPDPVKKGSLAITGIGVAMSALSGPFTAAKDLVTSISGVIKTLFIPSRLASARAIDTETAALARNTEAQVANNGSKGVGGALRGGGALGGAAGLGTLALVGMAATAQGTSNLTGESFDWTNMIPLYGTYRLATAAMKNFHDEMKSGKNIVESYQNTMATMIMGKGQTSIAADPSITKMLADARKRYREKKADGEQAKTVTPLTDAQESALQLAVGKANIGLNEEQQRLAMLRGMGGTSSAVDAAQRSGDIKQQEEAVRFQAELAKLAATTADRIRKAHEEDRDGIATAAKLEQERIESNHKLRLERIKIQTDTAVDAARTVEENAKQASFSMFETWSGRMADVARSMWNNADFARGVDAVLQNIRPSAPDMPALDMAALTSGATIKVQVDDTGGLRAFVTNTAGKVVSQAADRAAQNDRAGV